MSSRCPPERLRLIVITDPSAVRDIPEAVEEAVGNGATAVQLRWKDGSAQQMVELGRELRRITAGANALLIVNDRVDVALAIGADGAHVGDEDLPLEVARQISPPHFILGRSVDNPDEARAAENAGADYVGFGPIFVTRSKDKLGSAVGISGISLVRGAIRIPLVAIGGITAADARGVVAAGADGVAVIAAVMASRSPGAAAAELDREIRQGLQQRGSR
jgi:thiamine-phosphate pyrophosphorylase